MNPGKIFNSKYILASKSKRRIDLLKKIGLNFRAINSNVEETEIEDHKPVWIVRKNSVTKSRSVLDKSKGEIIIGADTVVVIDGKIIYKPVNKKHAIEILNSLSGRKHIVYTGINLIDTNSKKEIFDYEKTIVEFRKLGQSEIKFYVDNYKPFDKAGAYGIQDDFGCFFVKKIMGDYYNVVGLPLQKLYLNLIKLIK